MMQVLIGLSDLGQILHAEVVTVLRPLQLIGLAHERLAEFARVEVWEDAVCIFRYPPPPA